MICVICQEEMRNRQLGVLACDHKFHMGCIQRHQNECVTTYNIDLNWSNIFQQKYILLYQIWPRIRPLPAVPISIFCNLARRNWKRRNRTTTKLHRKCTLAQIYRSARSATGTGTGIGVDVCTSIDTSFGTDTETSQQNCDSTSKSSDTSTTDTDPTSRSSASTKTSRRVDPTPSSSSTE